MKRHKWESYLPAGASILNYGMWVRCEYCGMETVRSAAKRGVGGCSGVKNK